MSVDSTVIARSIPKAPSLLPEALRATLPHAPIKRLFFRFGSDLFKMYISSTVLMCLMSSAALVIDAHLPKLSIGFGLAAFGFTQYVFIGLLTFCSWRAQKRPMPADACSRLRNHCPELFKRVIDAARGRAIRWSHFFYAAEHQRFHDQVMAERAFREKQLAGGEWVQGEPGSKSQVSVSAGRSLIM